ncbi:hypothetical protein E1258_12520 [Micromonospora sp. KC207]|uniref:hypothetical protein n=1 Tax=Micromonospora sp. KC207 TaxID=2530377 RepID=UPI001043BDED|nr:hypothetical protein [Micromonospora sp. KC207]TDC61126.1 hypothetical protein E1258_12520 [Micromonospora sp. KC207]
MKEQQLRRLLTVATEDIRPTRPAVDAWQQAGRTQRARRAAGAVALAVALVTGGALLALRHSAGPPPTDPASAAPGPTAPVAPVPDTAPVRRMPADLAYPGDPLGRIGDPATVPLSRRPVRRALALAQPVDPDTGVGGQIRVLGDDGTVRALDVVTLAPTRDADGNEAVPLKTGSLSPDGRFAAFAQTGAVLVVDLTTAAVRRLPLAGYLEHVVWSGGRLLVGDDRNTYLLDPGTGTADQIAVSPWGLVTPDPAALGGTLVEITGVRDRLTLRTRSVPDGTIRTQHPVRSAEPVLGYRIVEFYGRGWQRGDRVARSGWIANGSADGIEGVAVLDSRTGSVTHLLDLGRDRWKGCCEVQGWESDGTVLLRTQPGGLIRWRPDTGGVTGVVPELTGVISLAG